MRLHPLLIALFIHGATAAVVRKQPAFATPIYSDSYLPASMQVIFHIVDQLKSLEAEEVEKNLLLTPSTSPHPPGQKQPLPIESSSNSTVEDDQSITASVADEEKYNIPPERYQEEALIISKLDAVDSIEPLAQVTPEINHERSEVVYGVPETNYELSESNHELPEETSVSKVDDDNVEEDNNKSSSSPSSTTCNEFKQNSELVKTDETTLTVDSVVKEIYSIVKTSSSTVDKNSSSSPTDVIITPQKNSEQCLEAKNSPVNVIAVEENKERSDELKDDNRFALIGEKVEQVPRPSLTAFLRANNVTSNPSLKQLGDLYDALSRDARRQGFSKFAGYSEKVLQYLVDSSGSGAGVQLKGLLVKCQENNGITRYDAMLKTKEIIGELNDDGSKLSTDLRQLLPLRFMP